MEALTTADLAETATDEEASSRMEPEYPEVPVLEALRLARASDVEESAASASDGSRFEKDLELDELDVERLLR